MKCGRKLKILKRTIEFLYYYRDIIGTLGFFILYLSSELCFKKIYLGVFFIILGMIFRFLGYLYLGDTGYSLKFNKEFLVVNGIYKYFKHPIYVGNFFIFIGFLSFLKINKYLYFLFLTFFIFEYALFIFYEEWISKNTNLKITSISPSLRNCRKELKTGLIILLSFFLFFLKI